MTTLLQIGDVKIDDADFAPQGFPALSYGNALKEYPLASGAYKTKRVNRKAPTMTIALVHAPGQQFTGGDLFSKSGGSWWGKLEPIVALQELEESQEVSVGDLDFGKWFVEAVELRGDKTTITGGGRGGYTSATFDITIRLKAEVDEHSNNSPSPDPGVD